MKGTSLTRSHSLWSLALRLPAAPLHLLLAGQAVRFITGTATRDGESSSKRRRQKQFFYHHEENHYGPFSISFCINECHPSRASTDER
jgi:hypothetical protein